MKTRAYSNQLEVEVVTDKDGLGRIVKGSFEIFLNYSERGENKKKIQMGIKYSKNQKEPISFSGEPEGVYFGDCNRLDFTISQDYLNCLINYNKCSERFMNFGRLKIEIK
ncbi:MAG: hypothetical protein NUV46_02380 [Nanoarchaeota archaeon]|nr:hypothetical protein [Nanoarchaeota archaeon]